MTHEDALTFAGSKWSRELSALGTSCPDHFLRTRVCPLFLDWDPAKQDAEALKASIQKQVEEYRAAYKKYYEDWATSDSPKLRDSNPSVVIVPGLGLFGFGKSKKEARIATEFFINAVHVMAGATALEDGEVLHPLPQARHSEQSKQFTHFSQLCGSTALGSIPNRVLGAGRGKTAAHARGSRVQPEDRVDCWRCQRHRPRGGASPCAEGSTPGGCRFR